MKLSRLRDIDFILFLSTILLSIVGILFIYSSNITSTGTLVSNEHIKQSIWLILSVFVMFTIAIFDYRKIFNSAHYIYIVMVLLLLYTRFFGRVVNGSRSWIGIGSMGIQPSELAKIITIIYLARYLEQSKRDHSNIRRILISGIIVLIPVALILSQPDLGTALVFFPILFFMIFIAGLPIRYLSYLLLIFLFTAILTVLPLWHQYFLNNRYSLLQVISDDRAVIIFTSILFLISIISIYGNKKFNKRYFFWISYIVSSLSISFILSYIARQVLKEYQIMRLIVFLNPEIDPLGAGWNIIQSITAIGSGGLFGKGYLLGTQSHYRYLPQQSTDFIFSIFSEEWGFFGGLVVFSLYFIILVRLCLIIKQTTDRFGSYIVCGLSAIYWFHFFINVGMTMGVMPITGIPLIFLSYGGSSLLTAMIGIGISLSIYIRRFDH